jgi:hypothetical protein
MATPEKYTTDREEVPPAPITFLVTEGDSDLGLRPGDRLEWNPAAPRGQRVTLHRHLTLHEGEIDRLQLRGKIAPPGLQILAARRAMVATLLADQQAAA